ncbi:MAG: N-6 DNA methylase [Vicinamibacterales bacterium]
MSDGPIAGLTGTLISARAAGDWLQTQASDTFAAAATAIAHWAAAALSTLGPATSERRLLEVIETLFEADLGFPCRRAENHAVAMSPSGETLALFAFGWQRALALGSRTVLRAALESDVEWAIGFNGVALGIIDVRPAAPRRIAVIALDHLVSDAATAAFTAALVESVAFARGSIGDAVRASDASSTELKNGLRDGVSGSLDALTRKLPFDTGIAVLFRMLFVLFAEARSLVPVWHRVYRDHYSLAGLAARQRPHDARGVWAALEAGRRLLGAGCAAGTLQVTGFNGRLFAPLRVRKWAASAALDSRLDRPASDALASLVEYRPARGGARRVNYAELDVEELGSIYERVLDLDPAGEGRARKESGSFYTPRPLTEFLVRRTLAPLVAGASSERILALRVVDPAMGSGAFLIAALHYLAGSLERALTSEGSLPEGDVTEGDRRHFRRLVAQRCLYGVDANPTAVMLAKLSLWLATLSGDKPLGFLDHRLKCGNSLAGIDPFRAGRPPGLAPRMAPLPLFDEDACAAPLRSGAERSVRLARMPEDSLADVRRKQKYFETLSESALASWRALCDAWCAWWFLPARARPDAREYAALADAMVRASRILPRRGMARRLRETAAVQAAERFFHWPLEFPDVLSGAGLRTSPQPEAGGFDAVIGNPPWEMLRAGAGSRGRDTLKGFLRGSGLYALTGGHLNLYQLFLERSLQLARHGGRIGLVVPWGLMTDDGSAALRNHLLDGTRIDTLGRFDNAEAIFQAHRSLRFAALTLTTGAATETIEITRTDRGVRALDDLPDAGATDNGPVLTDAVLRALGGPSRRVPDVRDERTLAIAAKLARSHRALGDPLGWSASFGRELNLTEDRPSFGRSGMPVLEGKHVHPHRIDISGGCHRITRAAARRLLPHCPFDRPRLAYRDVTAATNRQTVIAAIVPAGMVTSHSLFCLRNDWDAPALQALCIILNSRVANFLIRLFVGSHLTTSLMEWLPVPERDRAVDGLAPLAPSGDFRSDGVKRSQPRPLFGAAAVRRRGGDHRSEPEAVEAAVANLYGLTEDERAAI